VEVLDQRVEKAALEFVIGDRACADVHESQGGKIKVISIIPADPRGVVSGSPARTT